MQKKLNNNEAAVCTTMATPPVIARARVRLGFYFADLIFVDRQSTAKTAKIGSLENFRPYGIHGLSLTPIPAVMYACTDMYTYCAATPSSQG